MSGHIPFELQVQIIRTLPVKTLIQCRSVSKTWKSLIDSSEFIVDHSLRHDQPECLLVRYQDPVTNEEKCVSFVDDDTFPHQKYSLTVPIPFKLLFHSRMVGNSRGLFCMCGYFLYLDPSRPSTAVVLWNPSIRKSIAIDVPDEFPHATVFGFGVCPVNSDPTIIKITRLGKKTETSKLWKVEVYTLSSGIWRTLSCNPPSKYITWTQVVIDRFIYWIALDKASVDVDGVSRDYNLILSFDITNENFGVIDLPDSLAPLSITGLSISKRKESLIVLNYTEPQAYGVWMMEHGVQKSFTKLFIIEASRASIRKTVGFRKSKEPILFLRFIEMEYDFMDCFGPAALVVYEPNSGHNYDLKIIGAKHTFFVSSYMETLLLLNCHSPSSSSAISPS